MPQPVVQVFSQSLVAMVVEAVPRVAQVAQEVRVAMLEAVAAAAGGEEIGKVDTQGLNRSPHNRKYLAGKHMCTQMQGTEHRRSNQSN